MSRGLLLGAANDDIPNGPKLLPSPAISPTTKHSCLGTSSSTTPSHISYAYPLTVISNIARVTGLLLCTSLTCVYTHLILFSLPTIYQGYLENYLHRRSRGRFENDSKAWNRVASWTARVCYTIVICTMCCLQDTLSVAYSCTGNNTIAVVFSYITASISVGGLLHAIIISVFIQLAKTDHHKVSMLPGSIDDREQAWRVQHIALVLSVPPSFLIWSFIFVVAATIIFPGEAQMHFIHLSGDRKYREGHLDTRSANSSPLDPPTNNPLSALPLAALILVATAAALVVLHFLFVLRTITRLTNTPLNRNHSADGVRLSQNVHLGTGHGTLGQGQESPSDCDSSGRDTSESRCRHDAQADDSSDSDIGVKLQHLRPRYKNPADILNN